MAAKLAFIATFLAVALLAPSPANAAWRRAESANFIVYGQAGEDSLRDRVALLEDYNAFLRALTGVSDPPSPNKLPVYVVKGHSDLEEVRPVASGVAGFYTTSVSGMAAFVDDSADGRGDDGDHVLLHEIAHHFMMQYRPTAYPPWYIEGFAEYVATANFTKTVIEYGGASRGRVATLSRQRWLPMEQILFSRPTAKSGDLGLYYAQSWLLVHHLMRDSARLAKLTAYLGATAKGEDLPAAFKRIFGQDPKALEPELLRYAKGQMTYTRLKRRSAAAAPAMKVEILPPSADDLLLAQATMRVGVRPERRAALLAQVRSTAAKYDDPFARRVLAQAEALYGDGVAADRLLDPILAAAPNDAEALYLKGMRYLVEARRDRSKSGALAKQAQGWFGKAHKADENHFPTLARYVEASSMSSAPTENTVEVLLLAHNLAPQVAQITLNAARLLMTRGHYEEAALLIAPLASSPHDSRVAEAARLLQARAQARQKAEAPAEIEAAEQ